MLLASVATLTAKELSSQISVQNLIFLRMLIGSAFLLPAAVSQGSLINVNALIKVSVLRGVFLLGVTALYFTALGATDAALAATLFHTYPLLVFLVGSLIYRGGVSIVPLALCGVSFVGVALILGPHAAAGEIGAVFALASAVLMSFRINLERQLEFDLNPLQVLFFSSLAAAVMLVPFVDFGTLVPGTHTLLLIVLLSAAATFSQLIALHLMALGEWKSVTVYAYAEIPFVLILSLLLFQTSIAPMQAIGMVIVMAAGVIFVKAR
ncbi:DMT family transporter [Anianabacter salinae]|uniref:DMT family transporter n=1 Tax=Anianabacter salinae TaxID=2851023 RepID=UPI002B1E92E0|nr:DMT family transporter [Anianabacter salinae]